MLAACGSTTASPHGAHRSSRFSGRFLMLDNNLLLLLAWTVFFAWLAVSLDRVVVALAVTIGYLICSSCYNALI
jgi:hypothetical protein